jgi:beta-lactam-binding protein with PASTA domain
VSGEIVDHRADVYALGVVLFEMLTGKAPFGGDSPVVIAYKRVAEDVPSPMAINPSVPRELDVIVARATARDPSRRYSTAGGMAEALRATAPRSDTGDIGGLVHHTQAIPIMGEQTIAVPKSGTKPPKQKHRISRRRWLALLLLLAFVGTAAFAVVSRTQKFVVPNVASLSQSEATRLLKAQHLGVSVIPQYDPTVQAGLVISQSPPAGSKIGKGQIVTINLSLGPQTSPLPDVRKMLVSQAEKLLHAKGFKVARVDAFSDTVRKLRVIDQQPGPGVPLQKDATVTLTVSKGPEVVPVPNVVGDPQESAFNDLKTAGFNPVKQFQDSETIAKGLVISVSPSAGTPLKKGSNVTMIVSQGPPLVVVPNVLCMSRAQAADALRHAGFKPVFQGLSGGNKRVVDQRPVANAKAPKGSEVDVVMGYGSTC